jgi:hypothetical protein
MLMTSSGTKTLKPQAALKPIPRQILMTVSIGFIFGRRLIGHNETVYLDGRVLTTHGGGEKRRHKRY